MLIGVLGWCSLVCTAYALSAIMIAARLKRRCGVFFRGIITNSDNTLTRFLGHLMTVILVGLLLCFLAVVVILAHADMLYFVVSIFNGALLEIVMPPWVVEPGVQLGLTLALGTPCKCW